jgi:hypothetical protein
MYSSAIAGHAPQDIFARAINAGRRRYVLIFVATVWRKSSPDYFEGSVVINAINAGRRRRHII